MPLIQNIEQLFTAPGVLSVLVNVPGQVEHRGGHEEALRLALLLRDELNGDESSTIAGELTILVQREPTGTVAIAMVTGHAGRKSIRRTIRRCAVARKGREHDLDMRGAVDLPLAGPAIDAAEAFR